MTTQWTVKRTRVRHLAAIGLILTCGVSNAQVDAEQRLLAQLRKTHPGTEFTSINASNVPGLFEVWMGPNVAFVSPKDPRFFVFGRVIDTKTMTDITGPKLSKAQRAASGQAVAEASPSADAHADVSKLPLADALKHVRGSGARTLYVFSDPACGFCRRLEPELAALDDVTVYTFVVPFQGVQLPQAVMCSSSPSVAWNAVMRGERPSSAPSVNDQCSALLARNTSLARSLNVQGTPSIFFADGSRSAGYTQSGVLEQRMAAAARAAVAATTNASEKSP